MTSYEKYKYWVLLSDYDIDTVKVLIEGQRWLYVACVCEQAVERLLKGIYVYHINKEVPKSKNITFIFNKISKEENFLKSVDIEKFNEEKLIYEEILIDLMFYHISDYPFSYVKVMDRFISEKTAKDIYEKTVKTLNWLKSFQKEEI